MAENIGVVMAIKLMAIICQININNQLMAKTAGAWRKRNHQ